MTRANEKPSRKGVSAKEAEVLMDLLFHLCGDVSTLTDVDLSRDVVTIRHRVQCEGLSFATKTLPAFGKAILKAYATGTFHRQTAFSCRPGEVLPRFLSGLTSRLFDMKTGALLNDPCYVAAWAIHQVTSFLYKYDLGYPETLRNKVLSNMVEVNNSLCNVALRDSVHPDYRLDAIINTASGLVNRVFSDLSVSNILPSHGPGSTNEGNLKQHKKYCFRRLDELLGKYYPEGEFYRADRKSVV